MEDNLIKILTPTLPKVILIILTLLIMSFCLVSCSSSNTVPTYSEATQLPSTETPPPSLQPVDIPKNFTVIQYSAIRKDRLAPFEITTPDDSNYYFLILRDKEDNTNEIGLFMYPGHTHEFEVPLGAYEVYVGTGKNWYGKTELFGDEGAYDILDEIFYFLEREDSESFYYSGYELELQTVSEGNLDSDKVPYDEIRQMMNE